ncbi:MAG: hypothetical protein PVF83_09175 [Anaerolineales bacterium]
MGFPALTSSPVQPARGACPPPGRILSGLWLIPHDQQQPGPTPPADFRGWLGLLCSSLLQTSTGKGGWGGWGFLQVT